MLAFAPEKVLLPLRAVVKAHIAHRHTEYLPRPPSERQAVLIDIEKSHQLLVA
jgi:hypothetical protein